MKQQFILVPREGLKASDPQSMSALTALPPVRSTAEAAVASLEVAPARSVHVRVLDTVSEDGPKLIEVDRETAAAINAPGSSLRAEPIVPDEEHGQHGHGFTESGDEEGLVSPDGNYRFSPIIKEHAVAARRIAQGQAGAGVGGNARILPAG